MGASKVIAVVHRTSATEFVESLGADVVLPLADGWAQAVREHTGGRGVDIVVDPVGGQAFDDAIRVLAIDGKLLVIGFAAGAIPTVKVNRLLLRNAGVLGVAWGEYLHQVPGSAALFSFGLNQLVAAGLKPPPPQRYPLSRGTRRAAVARRRRGVRQGRAGAVKSSGMKRGAAPLAMVAAPFFSSV